VIPDGSGRDRQAVDVLRIGLIDAIALTPDDTEARTVVPDARGRLIWSPPAKPPGLIPTVRDGLEILSRRRTPEVIVLPLRPGSDGDAAPLPLPDAKLPAPPAAVPDAPEAAPGKESRK
jgi:hypothetical protein